MTIFTHICHYTEAPVGRTGLRPTMAELIYLPVRGRIINVPKEVPKHKSMEFGMYLLSDRDIVDDIVDICGGDYVKANTDFLQAWLDGKGGHSPVTWDYLISALQSSFKLS